MAGPLFADRVKETTTVTGTGTATLLGLVTGNQSFAAIGNGNSCYYCIEAIDATGALTGDWEVGLGTYTSAGTTLTRSFIASSTGSAISFSAGTKNVFVTSPARIFPHINQGFALTNGYITATVSGNALTCAIKTFAGNDPSVGDPVQVQFRSATAATGSLTTLTLTAATSVVVSSGSTLGVVSGTPFRLWVVGFNDAGTFRLGIVLLTTNGTLSTMPLRDYMLCSSTAEGGAGAADSAQVIYTGTAVTSAPMRILGWLEYQTLATAGTWGAAPFQIHQQMDGDPLPGTVIQSQLNSSVAVQTGTTLIPFDDTIPQSGEGDQYFSQAIVPTSKANILEVEADVFMFLSVAGAGVIALFQDATAGAFACNMVGQSTGSGPWRQRMLHRLLPGTTSSTTIKLRGGGNNANTTTINGLNGARVYGGVQTSFLSVKEIMG